MVVDNMGLAHYAANHFNINFDYDHEEVVAVSYYGLVLAVLGYDPAQEARFSSYAVRSIKRNLYREFVYQYRTKPTLVLEDYALEMDENDDTTAWESLFTSPSFEDGTIGQVVTDQIIQKIIGDKKSPSKDNTRKVIALRYFYPDLTQAQIGTILGCSQRNVGLILQRIQRRYRQALAV